MTRESQIFFGLKPKRSFVLLKKSKFSYRKPLPLRGWVVLRGMAFFVTKIAVVSLLGGGHFQNVGLARGHFLRNGNSPPPPPPLPRLGGPFLVRRAI